MSDDPEVFISFANSDGLPLARELEVRLQAEGISTWFEPQSMKGGEDWKRQILAALDQVRCLLLVLTKGAQESDWVTWEWKQARDRRVVVVPVMPEAGETAPEVSRFPAWIRNKVDLWKDPRDRERIILHIRSKPARPPASPFLPPPLPDGHVRRDREYTALRDLLLDGSSREAVAITTALEGGGGFGKTTLAKALCHDRDIQDAFYDGVVFVELGPHATEAMLIDRLSDVHESFFLEPLRRSTVAATATELARKLQDTRALVVIDDIWRQSDLRPFLDATPGCGRLFTTRLREIAVDARARRIDVNRMDRGESVQLLRNQVDAPYGEQLDNAELESLATLVGDMPFLLTNLGKSLNKQIVLRQQGNVARAVQAIKTIYRDKGVVAFDVKNEKSREYSIAITIDLSLDFAGDNRERALDLGIFPPETDIPFPVLRALWGLDDAESAHDTAHDLADLGLVHASAAGLRIHDVPRDYFYHRRGGVEGCRALHARLLDAWGDPHALPDDYAWRHYSYHLDGAGRLPDLRPLLFDYRWLRARLAHGGPLALRDEAARFPDDPTVRTLGQALELSADAVQRGGSFALRTQLYGRLMDRHEPEMVALRERIREVRGAGPWLRPLRTGLSLPGGPILRMSRIPLSWSDTLALSEDGRRAVSGSADGSVILWDLEGGGSCEPGRHGGLVRSVSMSRGGGRAVSGASDGSVILWDLEGGGSRELGRHGGEVWSVSMSRGGGRAVSGADDGSVLLWDLEGGGSRELGRHGRGVMSVSMSRGGGRAVSGASDGSVILWDLEGGGSRELGRHGGEVWSVSMSRGGGRAVSGADDGSVLLWDLEGGGSRELGRHGRGVMSVSMSRGGGRAVSGASDGSVILWDLEGGGSRELGRHGGWVRSVSMSRGGGRAVSGASDGSVILWDLEGGGSCEPGRHGGEVWSVSMSRGGGRAVSGADDGSVILWDLEGGGSRELGRHGGGVWSVSMSRGGGRAVSGADDGSVILWDLEGGGSRELGRHGGLVMSVSMSSEGGRAVSGADDGSVILWDLEGGGSRELGRHGGWVRSVSMSRGGGRAVSGADDGSVILWDLEGGGSRELGRHGGGVMSVSMSRGGGRAVSGVSDGSVILWDLEGGGSRELGRHGGWVMSVSMSRGGGRAVSGASDGSVILWDLDMCQPIATFQAEFPVLGCSMTEDRRIVAFDKECGIHVLVLEEG